MSAQPTVKSYLVIWAALMALLAMTVIAANFHLGPFSLAIALTIALIKALLVMMYFMHLRYSNHLVWVFAIAGFVWLGIMIVLTMNDYISRGWLVMH